MSTEKLINLIFIFTYGGFIIGAAIGWILRIFYFQYLTRLNLYLILFAIFFALMRVVFLLSDQFYWLAFVDCGMSICASLVLVGNIQGNLRGLLFIFAYVILPLPARLFLTPKSETDLFLMHFGFHYLIYLLLVLPVSIYWILDWILSKRKILKSKGLMKGISTQ
ncbi:MAG: hypothetical protein J0L93_01475 [Deltaproteobacteria bacterium]|nr:hypothetical protein [Deltaproteobacteria bacterium]